MNKEKFKHYLSPMEKISTLKELLAVSEKKFDTRPAFFVKKDNEAPYAPISFGQLKMDIDALGTSFFQREIRDKKVAIVGENSYEWVVSYFATVNGGNVVVPIDKELKPKEILNLLNRAEVEVLILSERQKKEMEPVMKEVNIPYIIQIQGNLEEGMIAFDSLVEEGRVSIAQGNKEFLDYPVCPDEFCTLLFTSGTTGMAKGVMLSHRNLAENTYNISRLVGIDEGSRSLSVLPMHHAYEMTCHVFIALYQGIGISICRGLRYIQSDLMEAQASILIGVPLLFENMHKKIMKNAKTTGKYPMLRKMIEFSKKSKLYNNQVLIRQLFRPIHKMTGFHVDLFIVGGAACNPEVIRDFEAMGFPMIQGYGMTEHSPIIAANRGKYSKAESVGALVPEGKLKIHEPDGSGIGEIVVKSSSVMLGYYMEPEQTAEIIKDGWLYTGDYGYMDKEGLLYITGRKKNVIVTKNGKNIFPEEIEFLLGQSDYVGEILVYGLEEEGSEDLTVTAEIYPAYDEFEDGIGDEEVENKLKAVIEEINEEMAVYKRIKRLIVRKEPFNKTTTQKIKR